MSAILCVAFIGDFAAAVQSDAGFEIRQAFAAEVDRQLNVPDDEQLAYATRLDDALSEAGLSDMSPQFVVIVDRSRFVQAILVYLKSGDGDWQFIGASPASTGQTGRVGYFLTPLGIFSHTFANPDFRAEGTQNAQGILGYGRKGMRVYDFGWVRSERGWGSHATSIMRLQMHATDPRLLEPQLGVARSKGCIRIPATLNDFIDHYGLLDADYERLVAEGTRRVRTIQ